MPDLQSTRLTSFSFTFKCHVKLITLNINESISNRDTHRLLILRLQRQLGRTLSALLLHSDSHKTSPHLQRCIYLLVTCLAMTTTNQPFYPVTGRSDTGIVAPRLSIQELQADDEQFTLFILSYLNIQDRGGFVPGPIPIPPGTGVDAAKFFNIAAIHGKPYTRWLGDHEAFKSDYDKDDKKDTDPVPSRFGGMYLLNSHFETFYSIGFHRILQVRISLSYFAQFSDGHKQSWLSTISDMA